MKHLFVNLQFNKIKNAEIIGFYRNIADAVDKADATKLQLKAELQNFTKDIKAFDSAFNGVFSSKYTKQLAKLNELRDNDIRGIRFAAKSAIYNRDAALNKAGNIILTSIDKYGTKLNAKPDKEKTTIIRNICDDAAVTGDFKDALQALGLLSWIDAINTTNNDFEKKSGERNQDVVVNKNKISPSQAVLNARTSYEKLLKGIDARNTLDDTGKYTALVDAINNLIKATNTLIKAKGTTTKKAKAKTGTTVK